MVPVIQMEGKKGKSCLMEKGAGMKGEKSVLNGFFFLLKARKMT